MGVQEKLAQDLEVQIEQEMTRVTRNNFDRIQADLVAVRQENDNIVQKLKSVT